jgi:ankyrin repeat protein
MQAKSTPPAPTLDNLHTDILVLVLLQFKIDDPLYFIRLVKVCRKLRANLGGENAKKYWQSRLKNDFPEAYSEGIDYKKVYIEQWQEKKKNNSLSPFHRQFFKSVRSGDLTSIRSETYCRGNAGAFQEYLNDFMDVYDKSEVNAVSLASKYERREVQEFIYQYMVEKYFRLSKSGKDLRGRTQLHWAAACGMISEIERLKDTIKIDDEAKFGTPLFFACRYNQVEAVKALIAAGASVNFVRKDHCTPIFTAVRFASIEIFHILKNAGAKIDQVGYLNYTPLFNAAYAGDLIIVEALLAAGANSNHIGSTGQTPIFHAVCSGSKAVVEALVTAGANVNQVAVTGETPLFQTGNRAAVINYLLEKGALVNHATPGGITPLFIAASKGQVKPVTALVAAGGNVNSADAKGLTPIFMAARAGHYAVVKILLAAGANAQLPNIPLALRYDIRVLFMFWKLRVANKDKSLCEQILVILGVTLEWTTSITSFFSKPEIINILDVQKNNPELKNNVEHLTDLLQKYKQQIPDVNFEFIMDFILLKDKKQVQAPVEMIALETSAQFKK